MDVILPVAAGSSNDDSEATASLIANGKPSLAKAAW
jgi:hypothetical protein